LEKTRKENGVDGGSHVLIQWKPVHVIMERLMISTRIEEEIKRWMAKRKSAVVFDLIQGKTTVAEASHVYDLSPSEIDSRSMMASQKSCKPYYRKGNDPSLFTCNRA